MLTGSDVHNTCSPKAIKRRTFLVQSQIQQALVNTFTQLQPLYPMLSSTPQSAQLSPLLWKLLDLETLSHVSTPDSLSPLDEFSTLKCFPPPTSTPFHQPDSENFIDRASVSDERWYDDGCFVHCQTMDKNKQNEYYTPQDPGLQNALQLLPEPDIVVPCWTTNSTFSFCNCMQETSSDNGSSPSSTSHVRDDRPRRQIVNPIVVLSLVHCLEQWLRELEEMVDQLVKEYEE
ncbi:hypothetical protein F5050DRAFT_1483184 [Lentinula boryana]|uniref:Uncharacterized protein n=1 Tax=Lentinula boryana TaxID=40481 RepID=A0ABQ8QF16_9AGAR|nr:hypothetical protein F5050DRAFT_1483184 [Lentinula boryana]